MDKKEDRDRIFLNLLVPSHKTWIRFDESKISLFIHLLLSLGKGNMYLEETEKRTHPYSP